MTLPTSIDKRYLTLSNRTFLELVHALVPGERQNEDERGVNLVLYTVNDHRPVALVLVPEQPELAEEAFRR